MEQSNFLWQYKKKHGRLHHFSTEERRQKSYRDNSVQRRWALEGKNFGAVLNVLNANTVTAPTAATARLTGMIVICNGGDYWNFEQ